MEKHRTKIPAADPIFPAWTHLDGPTAPSKGCPGDATRLARLPARGRAEEVAESSRGEPHTAVRPQGAAPGGARDPPARTRQARGGSRRSEGARAEATGSARARKELDCRIRATPARRTRCMSAFNG